MVVVGRAGIGLDNVDVEHATERGRDGRQRAAVEHPLRRRADAWPCCSRRLATSRRRMPRSKQGRWERSRWEGVELADKVLGIIGLGRIGKLVAQRASAFGMRLVAYDPFVSAERARQMNVELGRPRRAHAAVRLRHHPRRQDEGDPRARRQGPARQGEAGHPHHQRGPWRHRRRRRARRRHPLRARRRRRARRVRRRAD